MSDVQQGILTPIDSAARYLTFTMSNDGNVAAALAALREIVDGRDTVVGFGHALAAHLGHPVPGLTEFPAFAVKDRTLPATPADVGLAARRRSRRARAACAGDRTCAGAGVCVAGCGRRFPLFERSRPVRLRGRHGEPEGDDAVAAAIVTGQGAPTGELRRGPAMAARLRPDGAHSVGRHGQHHRRRRADNEELDDAPEFAHVKRTAQESFGSRRSCCAARRRGRTRVARASTVAFGCSFRAFDVQMRRMSGADDGIVDGLFRFTRPLTGAYFWCPPLKDGKLDLSALGL